MYNCGPLLFRSRNGVASSFAGAQALLCRHYSVAVDVSRHCRHIVLDQAAFVQRTAAARSRSVLHYQRVADSDSLTQLECTVDTNRIISYRKCDVSFSRV